MPNRHRNRNRRLHLLSDADRREPDDLLYSLVSSRSEHLCRLSDHQHGRERGCEERLVCGELNVLAMP